MPSKKPTTPTKRKLTGKQRHFVAEYIANGKNARQAAFVAYPNQTPNSAQQQGSENLRKPLIQEAIESALIKHELTPEHAVMRIKQVSDMELTDKSAPSVLKASNTILELHGWRKDERPQMTLNVRNAFFGASRRKNPVE